MAIDPTCGTTVTETYAFLGERDGRVFYFCSRRCRQEFLSKTCPTDLLGESFDRDPASSGKRPHDDRSMRGIGRKAASRWQALKRTRSRRALLFPVFHPRAGRTLPNELRAETVSHLAETLPRGVRDAEFERLVNRIMTGPVHRCDRIEVFFHGEDALAAVLRAIDAATEEVLVEAYILRDDATGQRLLQGLSDEPPEA